jgi:hypothetical protein
VFDRRRGWTLRQRVLAPHSYGLLLLLIVASLFATAWSDATGGVIVTFVLQGGILLFALHTSRVRPNVQRIALVLVVVMAAALVVATSANGNNELAIGSSIRLILSLTAAAAVLRGVVDHPTVDGETLMGALSLYLLLGMVFASVFGLIGGMESGPFFVGSDDGSWVDRLYFSFTTMTTVGYGDLTASSDLGRMLAITEALLGQLYLVSVVAVVVSNLGRTRRPKDEDHRA